MWYAEQKIFEQENQRDRFGGNPRDISSYSEWRDKAEWEVTTAYDFYGTYLVGQTSGLSDALNLSAVRVALEIDEIDRDEWSLWTRRLLLVHQEVSKLIHAEEKRKARSQHGGPSARSR